MSQTNNTAVKDIYARFKGNASPEERIRKAAVSAPQNGSDDFSDFICSWGGLSNPKLTAKLIGDLLASADMGYSSELASLFQTVLEKEPAIAAHIQTRVLAVLACDWSVEGKDTEKASELENILRKAKIHSLMTHLLDAVAIGYSGAAVIWGEGGAEIKSFRKINPVNWVFDLSGNPAVMGRGGQEKPLADYHPYQFVFHSHKLKCGISPRGGLLRPLLWLYFFKHYAMRDRARYLERFGIPFILAKINRDDFDSDTIRGTILSSLSKIGSDGVGLVTGDSDLQMLNSSSNSSSDYQTWMDYIDRLCAQLILGQTATSGDASGLSKGQAQENVRRDIIEADCKNLMETINTQIIAPLEMYRYGTSGEFTFTLDYAPAESLSEKAQVIKLLADSGFAVSPEWVSKTFGVQLNPAK